MGGVRMNYIPRDGGNAFTGSFFGTFANSSMQGSNLSDDLKARGLQTATSIDKNSNPAAIVRDRSTVIRWFSRATSFCTLGDVAIACR